MMIKGETPRKLDAQEAYAKAENVKEWLERFAETGDGQDYDKLVAKYKELGKIAYGRFDDEEKKKWFEQIKQFAIALSK